MTHSTLHEIYEPNDTSYLPFPKFMTLTEFYVLT